MSSSHNAAETAVFLVGLHEGVVPFVAKLFDWHPGLSLPLRLSSPWWWIVSLAVIIVAVLVLDEIEKDKKRKTAAE